MEAAASGSNQPPKKMRTRLYKSNPLHKKVMAFVKLRFPKKTLTDAYTVSGAGAGEPKPKQFPEEFLKVILASMFAALEPHRNVLVLELPQLRKIFGNGWEAVRSSRSKVYTRRLAGGASTSSAKDDQNDEGTDVEEDEQESGDGAVENPLLKRKKGIDHSQPIYDLDKEPDPKRRKHKGSAVIKLDYLSSDDEANNVGGKREPEK